ncbi:hypothetical protein KR009_002744 [Drosophila setifemur]|nr:hypothetical protein KR009_002744 [Drosophila setifemur]
MKFLLILSCTILYLALIDANENCKGKPTQPQNCLGGRNEGFFNSRSCGRTENANMWFYDNRSRNCLKLQYRGCGGNLNRYCSQNQCKNSCRGRPLRE